MNKKQLILLLSICIIGAFAVIAFIGKKKSQSNTKKLKVTTSFYPLSYLVERIGGDAVFVTNLTPVGSEPHDFEPSTRDIALLEKQDLIVLSGGGLEGYADKIAQNINTDKTTILLVGEQLMSDPKDPHVWLDPVLYSKQAEVVGAALMKLDPINAKIYTKNMKELNEDLGELNNNFMKGLANCKQRSIVTSHNAFGYLAKRYDLKQVALSGLSPDEEPSSKTLTEITAFAKNNDIHYIFFEELVNPQIAETIANEIGAGTLVFSPLEGLTHDDVLEGKTYLSVQRENLANLKIALDCAKQ
ncbi:MAG: zinc ABC transporter substrate-binding protein [Microgenomates group bacterium]